MNPSFGASSALVGGADADLIAGDELIDWKVVKRPRQGLRSHLAQLAGYAILSQMEGRPLKTCSLYFARHGITLSIPTAELLSDNIDEAIERFKRALGGEPIEVNHSTAD